MTTPIGKQTKHFQIHVRVQNTNCQEHSSVKNLQALEVFERETSSSTTWFTLIYAQGIIRKNVVISWSRMVTYVLYNNDTP